MGIVVDLLCTGGRYASAPAKRHFILCSHWWGVLLLDWFSPCPQFIGQKFVVNILIAPRVTTYHHWSLKPNPHVAVYIYLVLIY